MSEPTVKDYSEIYRLGQADERRRIIELLEDLAEKSENAEDWLFHHAVQLLKMENK